MGQRPFHNERILAIRIVARTQAHCAETQRPIERLRFRVARTHLKRALPRTEIACIGRHASQQLAGDAATTRVGRCSHLENLHFPIDHPAARIAEQVSRRPKSRPPGAVGARKLVLHRRLAPRIASHDARFEGGNIGSMSRIKRLIRYTVLVGTRAQHGRFVHGRVVHGRMVRSLDASVRNPFPIAAHAQGFRILHAGNQVLRIVYRQARALVFLRVGKARVHGQHERGVVAHRIEGVGLARPPCSLQRKQKPPARRRPYAFGKHNAVRLEQIGVFRQSVAGDLKRTPLFARVFSDSESTVWAIGQLRGCSIGRKRNCSVGQLRGCSIGLHHMVGVQAHNARIGNVIANRIDFLAHGVGRHQHAPAHAGMPRAPCHRIERRNTHKRQTQRRSYALRCGHGDAHARERTRAAPHRYAGQVAPRNARIGQQRVDAGQKLRVRSPPRHHLDRRNHLDTLSTRKQAPRTRSKHLVRRVEREHITVRPRGAL